MDESEYAVKKIVLKIDNKSTKRIKSEIENVMSEIRCLARIKNENVVRYNHSWIEVKLKENEKHILKRSKELNKEIPLELAYHCYISFNKTYVDVDFVNKYKEWF